MRSTIAAVLIFAIIQSLDCLTEPSNSRLNYFDIDLLRYVAEGKTGNVMVSPASIKSTLAMLLEGARGATAAEIQTALRLTPNKDDYRQQLNMFMKDLQVNTSSVTVQNANGLFVSKKLQLNKEYEKMAKRLYFSEVNNVDFNDPRTSADIINGWVRSKTKGLIPDIIDPAHITPYTELLVTNALYFKGIWQHEFEPQLTHADCFFRDGVCRNVAMMELDAELNYAYVDNLRAHALELPYQGKRYSMILLVPTDRDAGVALTRDLPYIGVLQISKLLQPSDVILTMPKFTVEYEADMAAVLKNMRINSLFTTAANLSGIFEDPRASGQINSIFHKVYMQVDEKGTVAAAASAGIVVPLINNYVNLRIDRPFLFFIWDNEKGVVLFEGKIEEPTEFTEINNRFDSNNNNKGQETIKPQAVPYPTYDKWTPGPFSQAIPNQQQVPIQPIVIRPVNSQPIQGLNQPISGQPIQQGVNQQIHSQPIQQGVNQQVHSQPIQQGVNQQVHSQPIQQVVNQQVHSQPTSPTNQPIPSTNLPLTTPPTTEAPTTSPPIVRKSEPWYKKVSGYFG